MEATELMAGNYLSYNGQIIKVANITNKKVGYHVKDNECRMHYARLRECKPVPLTPEVLARMGFTIEEVPKYDDSYTEDEYIATMKCVDSRKCEVEVEYKTYWKKLRAFNYDHRNGLGFTSIETQVENVHELQQIMRLLGIEKEIIL